MRYIDRVTLAKVEEKRTPYGIEKVEEKKEVMAYVVRLRSVEDFINDIGSVYSDGYRVHLRNKHLGYKTIYIEGKKYRVEDERLINRRNTVLLVVRDNVKG